ncbi:MAG: hypothetical protein AAGB04_32465 [Pseudomonadota bacterium]
MDILADANRLPDSLIDALGEGQTPQEKHFERVIYFHGNVLNGGLSQAIYNLPSELSAVPSSFRELGITALATLIEIAIQNSKVVDEDLFEEQAQALDQIYIAAGYDLGYACNNYKPDDELTGSEGDIDWVDRLALKYARTNRQDFGFLIAAST